MAAKKFPVEASHILMFARSVGDKNQVYYDEDYAKGTEVGGIIAPPTFAQSSAQFDPNYFLRPKIGEPWFGSAKEPTGIQPAGTAPSIRSATWSSRLPPAPRSSPAAACSWTWRCGPAP